MGFFKKIFGGASFEGHRKEADAHFERSEFQDARIAYERALDRRKDGSASDVTHCEERMAACLDRMAEQRIEEAARLMEEGHADLAEAELQNAAELAASPEIAKRANLELERLEQADARERASIPDELDDDARWAILVGRWEADRLDEADAYGEPFRDAVLALHAGRAEEAKEKLEALAEEYEDPVYLWLEIGRARFALEDDEGAEEALEQFIEALDEDEGGIARLGAHELVAMIRDRAGDEEGAMAELSKAVAAFPDEPIAFLMMGRYLRAKGHAEEAVEVLEQAAPFLDEDRPDPDFLEELGVACADAGEDEKAAHYLDRVIAVAVNLRRLSADPVLPPRAATSRAKLFEEAGELERAADMFRTLARGPDHVNHLLYHREAARLLIECELVGEARRMLTRALALAGEEPEARAEIEKQLAELE